MLISHCVRVIYLVFAVSTRWLLSMRALLVGVVLAQDRNSSKEKTTLKVSCKFCREELTYHGATSAMHEHCLKCKHPIEMEGDQPRARIWTEV